MSGLFIAGTDTDIGKTYVASMLIRRLRGLGYDVAAMKPVASGVIERDGRRVNEDIECLTQAAGRHDAAELINQYCYEPFVAPHIVAGQQGEQIELEKIHDAYARLQADSQIVVVEGAGGLMTPLTASQTYLDLIARLDIPVVLVVGIRLGCINHGLMSEQVLGQRQLRFAGWIANYPQKTDSRDIPVEQSLASRLSAPCLGVVTWGGREDSLDIQPLLAD